MKNEKDSESELEKKVENSPIMRRNPQNESDPPTITTIEIPHAVQEILARIEQAQLLRAREDINSQMNDIMNNVHRIMARYTLDFNLQSERNTFLKEHMKKQRTIFLDKMASYAKNAEMREKTLAYILAWLEEWNAILSDITATDIDEHYHWIVQMELFPDTLRAIENNVNILCRISTSFLEEKKKHKKKILSRGALWKNWKERAIKRPATTHALRPDQMIADQFAINTKVSEIQNMLQELIGTGIFNKLENTAIKYISSTILNLLKALTVVNDELKIINIRSGSIFTETYVTEKELSLKMIQDLSQQNEILQQKLQEAEENYEQLIQFKGITDRQEHTPLPVSTAIIKDDNMEDSMDNILYKEFENIAGEFKIKDKKAPGKKWFSKLSHTAPDDMTPDVTAQHPVPENQKRASRVSEEITEDKMPLKKDDVSQKDGAGQYQPQQRKYTKGPQVEETSRSKLREDVGEDIGLEAKPNQYSMLQVPEKKRKEIKLSSEIKSKSVTESKSQHFLPTETKSRDGKSRTSGMQEKPRKLKTRSLVDKSSVLLEDTESIDKQGKSESDSLSESLSMTQVKHTSMPLKAEIEGKTQQTSSSTTISKEGKTKGKEMLTKSKLDKSHSRTAKVTPETIQDLGASESKSERSNVEAFQKAIMNFLKEKINNIQKPSDRSTMLKEEGEEEEELLQTAEIEQLGIIKEKIEEYFKNVTEIVTNILRKYQVSKKEEQVEEKPMKEKKEASFKLASHYPKSSITTAESEISTFLSNESVDPTIKHLIQVVLTEMETARDATALPTVAKDLKKEKQKQEEYLEEDQEEIYEEATLHKKDYKKIHKTLRKKKELFQKEEESQGQEKEKQGPEEELWAEQQKQRLLKQTEQEEQHRETGKEKERRAKQQEEAGKQTTKEGGALLERENEEAMSQAPKAARHPEPKMRGKREKQKPSGRVESLERQRENEAKDQKLKGKESEERFRMEAQTPAMLDESQLHHGDNFYRILELLRGTSGSPASTQSSPYAALPIYPEPLPTYQTLTPQQAQDLMTILAPQQVQDLTTPLIPQQIQALGTTLTPAQVQALRNILSSPRAVALGPILTPQQVQALGTTLAPQEAQELGATLTPEQVQVLGTIPSLPQAEALGPTLTPQQVQALMTTLTPAQVQALGTILSPLQAEALGTILTPLQAQAPVTTLTPAQVQALGTTLTPAQVQALGTILSPPWAEALGTTPTPQQSQALTTTPTPQLSQALTTTLIPQQAQAPVITLTPAQFQVLGTTLTTQQAQALTTTLAPQEVQGQGPTLTPLQAQAPVTTLTPAQVQALGTILSPLQAEALGTILTPLQAQAPVTTLTPAQVQALGSILTPQQAEALGPTLTPQQVQDLTTTVIPQQIQALGTTLTPAQVQALGTILSPPWAEALGTTPTPQQSQALTTTLTPQQSQALTTTLTPQQSQALTTTLIPQQAQAPVITLTPAQFQVLGTTLTTQQAQALTTTLAPQEVQGQGPTLTPLQAQAPVTTLTPAQVQALGSILSPPWAEALGTTPTPQQSQALTTTPTPQQSQALTTTLTPQQSQALTTTLTPQQSQTPVTSLSPAQVQALGTTLITQQAQALGTLFSPQQSQALMTTLMLQQPQAQGTPQTPQQIQVLGTTLTLQQAEALGTTVTPLQAKVLEPTLTPQQAQALGTAGAEGLKHTLTPKQAQALETILTPEQAQVLRNTLMSQQAEALGPTLTPQHAQTQGTPFIHEMYQGLDMAPTHDQAKALQAPLTLEPALKLRVPGAPQYAQTLKTAGTLQIQARQIPLTVKPTQIFGVPGTQEQAELAQAIGATLTPELARATEVPLTFTQGQSSGVSLIPGAPPTPGQPLELEALSCRQLFLSKHPLAPLAPRRSLKSELPPFSGKIPSHWAPLPSWQSLAPGAPSTHEELLESGPLAFSGKPQAFLPSVSAVKSPSLQATAALGQSLAPSAFPGQASPPQIPPLSGHLPTLWTPSVAGKPQKAESSFDRKKRSTSVSFLQSQSSLVQHSVPDFKAIQAPFTAKKIHISEVSVTAEETFQSYITSDRAPVSHTSYIEEEALIPQKPRTTLPPLTARLLKPSQLPALQRRLRTRLPSIDKPWIKTSALGIKETKMMVPPSSPQEPEKMTYFVDVDAQRKNLILLNQAIKTSAAPSQLHVTARNLIIETLHADTIRLGFLFHKYIAYRLIQCARNNIIRRVKAIQNTGRGYETKNLYVMLSRIDDYQKKVMHIWTEKQKLLEEKRNQCLRMMIPVFSQLREMYKLNLSQPTPLITDKKQIPVSTKYVQQPIQELPVEKDRLSDKKIKQQEDQLKAIWNADLSTSSYPITEKTPVSLLWAQLGGFPDIPRLLQLDIQSTYRKSLASLKTRCKKTPK
ncbi:protein FAM186A isoform X1 [Oryctolagus cuniculus]|uniref:protein FAM186A isoform X1 n=2 Tax=Oryctolagus cuniculus TaxID=9986 RepID=UPI003879805F